MKATVQIELQELDEIRARNTRLVAQLANAERLIKEARLGPEDSDVRRLADAFTRSLTIVQFAIATMDPLTVRGWPYRELYTIADALPSLPGIADALREIATAIREFASRAESWELTRAQGKEQERLMEENQLRGAGNAISMWGAPSVVPPTTGGNQPPD